MDKTSITTYPPYPLGDGVTILDVLEEHAVDLVPEIIAPRVTELGIDEIITEEGAAAAWDGYEQESNPYVIAYPDSKKAELWEKGYLEGQLEIQVSETAISSIDPYWEEIDPHRPHPCNQGPPEYASRSVSFDYQGRRARGMIIESRYVGRTRNGDIPEFYLIIKTEGKEVKSFLVRDHVGWEG